MTLEAEIPEVLFKEMNDFIELISDLDRQSFINYALTYFLLDNGLQVKHLKETYWKYLVSHSSKL